MTLLILFGAGIIGVFLLTAFYGAPYVPSKKSDVAKAFDELYPLKPSDTLVDIGSGDGKVCLIASGLGAKSVGYEINPILVLISKWRARNQPLAKFKLADFWHAKLPDSTTIVYTFGDSRDIKKMANRVQAEANRIGRPIYFLSYAFKVDSIDYFKRNSTSFLYLFDPSLQIDKPQV